jgi:putative methionine-R-sulfoxide reductase with GAF domain
LLDARGEVRAVLDIDSDLPGAFDGEDQAALERLAAKVSKVYLEANRFASSETQQTEAAPK